MMLADNELLQQFKKHKSLTESGLGEQYNNNWDNFAFYAGDMMSYRDQIGYGRRASMVQFNKVKPYVSAVKGFMAQNRRKPTYNASVQDEQMQEAYSTYTNGVSDYCRGNANAEQVETQQDGDMLVCGYGVINTDISYGLGGATRDPNGEVIMERVHPNQVGWDPQARAANLLDRRWDYFWKQYYLEESESLFGKDFTDQAEECSDTDETNKQYNPFGGVYDKISYDYASKENNMINVYYYQWWEVEDYWRAANPLQQLDQHVAAFLLRLLQTIKTKRADVSEEYDIEDIYAFDPAADFWIMTPQVKNDVMVALKAQGVPFSPISGKRRVYYTAIISGVRIFRKFKSADQQRFTLQFKTADFDELQKVWFGMVTSLREPVLYYNKGLTEMMRIIAANSKGGVMVEKDAVEDIALFEEQWAQTEAVIEVEQGSLQSGKIQAKAAPALPTGIDTIISLSDAAMPDVVGFDKGFLGSSENKMETAQLQRQRIKQVMSTLATYFDAIILYQKEQGRLMLTFMRIFAENSDGRLIRLIGKDGAVILEQLSPDGFAEQYDVEVGEAPNDAMLRESQSDTMIQLATIMMQSGINIWPVAIKYLQISPKDQQDLIQLVNPQPNPDAQQMQAAMQKLHFDSAHADLTKKIADSHYAQAGAAERTANVNKIQAESQQKQLENQVIQRHPGSPVHLSI